MSIKLLLHSCKTLGKSYSTFGPEDVAHLHSLFAIFKRTLCINACVYNAEETVFAKTAKSIYDSLEVMHARAKKWITTIRSAHANTFINEGDSESADEFVHVRALWPGAAELFEDGKWLEDRARMPITDIRTRENELAWYGALAIKRALAGGWT